MKQEQSEAERMAMRDGYAMAALVGLLAGMSVNPAGGNFLRASVVSVANDAFALAEAMMEVRAGRPLP